AAPRNRRSTSTPATTTKRDYIAACVSPNRFPTRSRAPTVVRSLVVTSSAASFTSTTALPEYRLLRGVLTTPLRIGSRTLRSRAAVRPSARARRASPLTRYPPSLLHTSTDTAPLRV